MDTITGTWEGTLIRDDGKREAHFAFRQPPHTSADAGPVFSLDGAKSSARLLDGASRSFVALADTSTDPSSGRIAQLMVEARVLGDRLVGRWIRRDGRGAVIATGVLRAARSF